MEREENIVGKGENAGYQLLFFLFPTVVLGLFSQRCDCLVQGEWQNIPFTMSQLNFSPNDTILRSFKCKPFADYEIY